MPKKPIETWFFSLVVARLGHRFLLVQERDGQWYLPAGRVESGESMAEAAIRETREEAGIDVALDGLIRFEHTPGLKSTARCRAIFAAHPVDDKPPKRKPDRESLRADWVALDDLNKYRLRGKEPRRLFKYLDRGGPVYPLSVLTFEGSKLVK